MGQRLPSCLPLPPLPLCLALLSFLLLLLLLLGMLYCIRCCLGQSRLHGTDELQERKSTWAGVLEAITQSKCRGTHQVATTQDLKSKAYSLAPYEPHLHSGMDISSGELNSTPVHSWLSMCCGAIRAPEWPLLLRLHVKLPAAQQEANQLLLERVFFVPVFLQIIKHRMLLCRSHREGQTSRRVGYESATASPLCDAP